MNIKRPLKIVLIVVAALAIIRLILPYVVLHYANKTLAEMDGYHGHINDIDLGIIRGAYVIDSVYLNKVDSATQKESPFFSASVIDLSIEWKALLHGSIVGEVIFEKPQLEFTKDKVEPKEVVKDSSDFRTVLKDFMPLDVNRLEIKQGRIRYRDLTSKPAVDISLTDLHLVALNLRNSYDTTALLPASVKAHATVYEGTLDFTMKLNPLAEQLTFDMNTEVKNTNLVLLNEFFQAYAKIDVNKGVFGMYTEVAAKNGVFAGYVKPLIKNLDIVGVEDRKDNIFQKIWEGFTGVAGDVLENKREDQVATKIPLEGRLDNPNADIITTLANILQNAFIQAIQPSIDNEVSIASLDLKTQEKKGFFKKVFSRKKKK